MVSLATEIVRGYRAAPAECAHGLAAEAKWQEVMEKASVEAERRG